MQPWKKFLTSIVSDVVVWDQMDVLFQCQCSRERVEQTLISLGLGELEAILLEDGNAEVVCQFCNEAYVFDGEQLQELIIKNIVGVRGSYEENKMKILKFYALLLVCY